MASQEAHGGVEEEVAGYKAVVGALLQGKAVMCDHLEQEQGSS